MKRGRRRRRRYTRDEHINMALRKFRLERARMAGSHTKAEWQAMLAAIPYCVNCGSSGPLGKDHIVPIFAGGSDGIGNLQPMCKSCNCAKSWYPYDQRPHPLPEAWQLRDGCPQTAIRLPDLICCRAYQHLI